MLARIACRAQVGLTAPPVQVEAHLGAGLPSFSIVGLAATEVKESKERVRAALVNSGFEFPAGRITVNLAPADLPKDGGRFDLAVAVAILMASGQLRPRHDLGATEFLGELALDGALRGVRGALPAAAAAAQEGHDIVLPRGDARGLTWLPGVRAYAVGSLLEVCARLEGRGWQEPEHGDGHGDGRRDGHGTSHVGAAEGAEAAHAAAAPPPLLDDVCGQALGKRALTVAAAGGHSLLFVGPPGCGKSMLAQRLPVLLPPLAPQEALEVAMIASIAPSTAAGSAIGSAMGATRGGTLPRPFRTPHHTASAGAIIGGGSDARPGEITLAHRGVLFLDELPEFDRRVLEALREPLESGRVAVSRAGQQAEYPAAFQLVAAMNPCPCGRAGGPGCRCKPAQVERYRARLSGPLLDRLDIRVTLGAVGEADLAEHRRRTPCDDSPLRARIAAARERQWQRQGCLNAALPAAGLEERLGISAGAARLLASARGPLALSLRARHRCLRVARSLADLGGSATLDEAHLAEALALRRGLATE